MGLKCLLMMNKMVRVKVVKVLTRISDSHDVMGPPCH